MSKYKLTQKAQSDLIVIWEFTARRWSNSQANKYTTILLRKFEFLANNKNIGKSCNEIRNGYFKFPIESHIVFYQEIGSGEVLIIRILHKRSDIEAYF